MSAFMFEETFAAAGQKVMLIRPQVGVPFGLTLRTDTVLHYAVHFIGRAFLCPGPDVCPACGAISRRVLSMVAGGTPGRICLLELGSASMNELEAERRRRDLVGYKHTAWSFVRRTAKRPLVVTFGNVATDGDLYTIPDRNFLAAFATLFSLPQSRFDVTPMGYAEWIQPTLIEQIRKAVV